MKNINLIIDFDSTFIKLETIEVLAEIALKNNNNRKNILGKIKSMTNKAMNGELSFQEALTNRIKLINATENDILKTIEIIKMNISTSIIKNKQFFIENSKNCYIVSGGFKEIIEPIVKSYGIKNNQIFANDLHLNKNGIIDGINDQNELSMDQGKVKIAKKINGNKIILGDGYTDYEIKKFNQAETFIQFTENINRKSLNNKTVKLSICL